MQRFQAINKITLRKRITALGMTLLLMFSVTSCSSSVPSGPPQAAPSITPSVTPPAASPASTDSTAAASEQTEYDISAGSPPPWKGRDNLPVKINVLFAKGMTGIGNQFALAKGFYDDAGITVEQVETTSGVAAFAAGEIDFADGDPGTYIPAIINGVGIKIVSNMWRNRGAYWIVAKPEIKTWEDLKGKTVGAAIATGGMRLTIMEVLTQNGIDVDKDVELVANGSHQTAYATLVSGEVSATIIHQPFATIAEKEGTGHVLAKTWDYLPDYHTGVVVVSQSLIDEQPEVVERILEVYFYGNEYAKTHPDEFYAWAAGYLNLDEETARKAIEAEKVLWENDPIVDLSRLQVTEDLLTKFGMQRESLPVADTVDNRFAEKVARKLRLGKYRPAQ